MSWIVHNTYQKYKLSKKFYNLEHSNRIFQSVIFDEISSMVEVWPLEMRIPGSNPDKGLIRIAN